MTSNKLATARSIFEQNIAKNKQAGCEKNIFGHTAKPPCSRNVSRRLFASTKLSDSSNSSNGVDTSMSSLNDSSDDHNAIVAARRSSLSSQGNRRSSNRALEDLSEQAKGQKTVEYPRSGINHGSSTNYPPPSVIGSEISEQDEKLQPAKNKIRIHDAFSLKQAEKQRGSISSLAEHLNKLELKSLRPRGDNASQASRNSLEAHRDQIKLPDFRQSSYAVGNGGSHSLNKRPSITKTKSSDIDPNQDSISSIGAVNLTKSIQLSKAPNNDDSYSSLRQDSSMSSLDNSSQRHPQTIKPISRRPSRDRGTSSTDSRRSNGMKKSLSQFLSSSSSSGNSNSSTGWIQPSAIVDDDDSCSSHHHQQPFRAVPFTKSVIKRHRESLKPVSRRDSSTPVATTMNSNRSSLISNNSSSGRRPPLRRRSSMSNTSKRRLKEKTAPPPLLDPEEVALREELVALQKQIELSAQKLAQVQEGEKFDLKRVQEAKERKLKRIDAETEKTIAASTSRSLPLTKQQQDALTNEYLQAKLTIRQLKQENARLHDQNRKTKLEIVATQSSNVFLEESNVEIREFIAELEANQKLILLPENSHWMQLATTYQKALLDLEEALERKEPHCEKVKSDRIRLEDRIDLVVDFMQKKCKDYALVEELTMMAFDESEDGWEEGESESSDSDDESRSSFISPYRASDSDDDSKRSISDVLVANSSHSLHLFL